MINIVAAGEQIVSLVDSSRYIYRFKEPVKFDNTGDKFELVCITFTEIRALKMFTKIWETILHSKPIQLQTHFDFIKSVLPTPFTMTINTKEGEWEHVPSGSLPGSNENLYLNRDFYKNALEVSVSSSEVMGWLESHKSRIPDLEDKMFSHEGYETITLLDRDFSRAPNRPKCFIYNARTGKHSTRLFSKFNTEGYDQLQAIVNK